MLRIVEFSCRRLLQKRLVNKKDLNGTRVDKIITSSSSAYEANFQGSSSPSLPAIAARLFTVFGVEFPDFEGWF